MGSTLLINAAGRETRVALVENGQIAEFYLERKRDKGIVGNVYKGRVTRVLPGMQAAFVDIGQDKAAFLYVTDVFYDPEFARSEFELTEGEQEEGAEVPDEAEGAEADSAGLARTTTAELAIPAGESPSSAPTPPPGPSPEASVAPATPGAQAPVEAAANGTDAAPAASQPSSTPTGAEVIATAVAEKSAVAPPSGAEVIAAAVASAQSNPPPQSQGRESSQKDARTRREEREQRQARRNARIEDLLKVGQEVLVQVSKDPIGTKGARITCHISIPGRHLVFMPTVDHIGISRRIGNEKERRRLRDTVERLRPPGTGFIVRTVADNVPQEKLEADIRFLIEVWNETVRKNEKRHQPGLMHADLDLILRATRDLFAQDVEKLVIDDREEFERVQGFIIAQDPALKDRVLLHDNEEPIFDAYGIEEEIRRAVRRKVWLKSGGYLIMDQAEALTAIDVNSGRYVGKKDLEETITKINIEAAKEIVYQLRLRNIGGIIICDFIDMEKAQNREKVFRALQEALGRDKAKTTVLKISELGLIEMTRKRVRESIGRVLHEDCAYCDGQGFVKTTTTVVYEIFRDIRRLGNALKEPTLVVACQPEVAANLQNDERDELRHLMDRYNKSIQIKAQPNYHREHYELFARPVAGVEFRVGGSNEHIEVADYGAPKRVQEPNRQQQGRGGGDRDRKGKDRGRGRDRGRREERGGRPGGGDRGGEGAPPPEMSSASSDERAPDGE